MKKLRDTAAFIGGMATCTTMFAMMLGAITKGETLLGFLVALGAFGVAALVSKLK